MAENDEICVPFIRSQAGSPKMSSAAQKKTTYSSMTSFNEADRRKILESLTADELATFQEAFTVFDKNQDGTITTKVSQKYYYSTLVE